MVDSTGNIWGTAIGGGANAAPQGSPFSGAGVIFEYSSGGSFTVVHNFCGEADCADGGATMVTTGVKDALGRDPRDLDAFAADHVEAFKG